MSQGVSVAFCRLLAACVWLVGCNWSVHAQALPNPDDASRTPEAAAVAAAAAAASIDPDSGEALRIGLMTVSPGSVYWQSFGHNAILVENTVRQEAQLYNFGTFDFDQPNFLLNFLRGKMLYRLAAGAPARDLNMYAEEGRGVQLDWLNLTPDQRYAVAEMLAQNALPEHAEYRYDYFVDNCSTRVRNVIDAVLNGAARDQLQVRSEGATYRRLALQYGATVPWMAVGMDLGLGRHADRPISFFEQAFVPEQFRRFALEVQNPELGDSEPLITDSLQLVEPQVELRAASMPGVWIFAALCAAMSALWWWMAGAAPGLRRSVAAWVGILVSLVSTVIGAGLIALMTATDHSMAAANENVLLFLPTSLLLVRAFWQLRRGDNRAGQIWAWVGVLAGAAALLLKLDGDAQANGYWLALMLPWHTAVWFRIARPMA
ncbi:hypothetical protein C7S18_09140 [Ahniella affigens]|uniref:Lnb N-terminal periplasmic domain-containing protein n=1 Tax=Ahniella affigens TaxID=2021234 RepID=A0A2P1PR69_9GAMM|nr:DUF4105 domain-containing protein [Ahniella affigens]AVP97346.1 hypothetical protein C7S18_09140 [Ahniella affigens]